MKDIVSYLESFVTERRLNKMNQVLDNRTRKLTVVLEDIYQAQNASAVLRHCDALGVQDIHIIENRNSFKTTKDVDMGTQQWLTVNRYNDEEQNTLCTINKLKKDGYRIVATTPHTDQCSLEEIDISKGPIALVFGTELTGISDIVRENADEFMVIPMYGFVESYNISASCAMSLYNIIHKIRKTDNWHLTDQEKERLKLQWLRTTVKNAKELEERFNEEK